MKALKLEMEKEGLWLGWRNHKQGKQLNFSGSGSESLDYVATTFINIVEFYIGLISLMIMTSFLTM